ncbi:class I SAM-dependent methyltransferase [Geobacter grbiciae]|uniref:class I SAM-dependent methyltransferase n=1 Tax=Geobacter grbiciae TaxID=155042 RepID=UPI001C01C3D8|nr:SAM-dependent methyltransferase [Geobacter grbiciae]MBT1075617.1 SAM-dependent methyltransferase [Geobacter grbiciae]
MKLNIGCGHTYLKGHLNIDVSGDSVADAIMEAHDLCLDTASVDEIVASQLMEHLGFFKGKYFLAECFRVLRPSGTLRLETPHLERSFEIFLAGDRTAREDALTWLYGAETAGMQHRFCFPLELLRELVAEAGFALMHHESFLYQDNRPSLRLILRKPADRKQHEFMAELRKRLVMQEIPAFEDELVMAGQEELLTRLADAFRRDAAETMGLTVYSAEIVREYFTLKGKSDANAGKCRAVAARLAESRFQGALLAMLKARPEGAGRQGAAYRGTLRDGIAIISAVLAGKTVELPRGEGRPVTVFSEPLLKSLADKVFARGLKQFHLGEYREALDSFGESSRIFRDNPFVYWNSARIHGLHRNADAVRLNYEMALAALDASPSEVKRAHRQALMAEMNGIPPREPVAVMGKEGSA